MKILTVTAVTALLTTVTAAAHDLPRAGSLLIFPLIESQPATATLFAVTNTNLDRHDDPITRRMVGEVDVRFVFIDGETGAEFTRVERLLPGDTFAALASAHWVGDGHETGYMYAHAINGDGEPISFDWLIGRSVTIDGLASTTLALGAFPFEAAKGLKDQEPLDVDGDSRLEFNRKELERLPESWLQPAFYAQSYSVRSELILVNLSGPGSRVNVDCVVYNDNSEEFSFRTDVHFWRKAPLTWYSAAFTQDFLESTNHERTEIVGQSYRESGWFRMSAGNGYDKKGRPFEEGAILFVLVERIGKRGDAHLPYQSGSRSGGFLAAW